MSPPLEGLVLIDLASGIAGPYAAMLLADMGAECIKVEPRQGDSARGLPGFLVWNRGKRSLTLNLETDEGREIVHRLAEKADVVVGSFSPRRAERLGLDYQSLSRLNPRLVYCAIPPFGENGPLSEKPGDEGVIAALAGIMAGQGGPGGPPVFVTLPLASYGTAFLSAYGVAAALYVRETSGSGQKVEVSLLSGALAMQAGGFLAAEAIVPIAAPQGIQSNRSIQQGVMPTYRLYQCQDDWMFLACGNPTFWSKLCIRLGREDLVADPRFEGAPWAMLDVEHRDALASILGDIFRQKPRGHWLEFLAAGDVPCAPVSRREEFMEDPQVQHNQMIVTIDDPQVGTMKQMGIPVTLLESPGLIKGPAPRLGEHTDAVLRELGYRDEGITQLRDKGIT